MPEGGEVEGEAKRKWVEKTKNLRKRELGRERSDSYKRREIQELEYEKVALAGQALPARSFSLARNERIEWKR